MIIFERSLVLTELERKYRKETKSLISQKGDSFGTSNSALSNELLHATKDHINSSNIVDIIRYLKRHESFRGRLDFKQFNSIFKFENSIYSDKVLSYENLKRMNSDIIVDFASSVLTRFIYRDFTVNRQHKVD